MFDDSQHVVPFHIEDVEVWSNMVKWSTVVDSNICIAPTLEVTAPNFMLRDSILGIESMPRKKQSDWKVA